MKNTKTTKKVERKMRPALTPEAREKQLIALSMDVAEEKLRDGTASSQIIAHFLKMGSERERLEQSQIKGNIELQEVKKDAIESQKEIKELYSDALVAMRQYSGYGDDDEY